MRDTQPENHPARRLALRAALAYALAAGLWIILSDALTALFFPGAAVLQTVQSIKGGLFVALTALLLYLLIYDVFSHGRRLGEIDYRQLFDNMLDGFALHEIIVDENGVPYDYRFLDVNPAFERLTGLRRDAVVGKRVRDLLPGIELRWIETYGRVALKGEEARFEDYSGELDKHFRVMAFCPQKGHFATLFDDISEQKQAERKISRLTNLYAALSETNQSIVRLHEAQALFETVCRTAITFGKLDAAIIRTLPPGANETVVAASFGDHAGALAAVRVTTEPGPLEGALPTAVALREGKPCISNDVSRDPAAAAWAEFAIGQGIHSVAAFPLFFGQRISGALTLYSAERAFFDPPLLALLKEMAMDISFALENFEREKTRVQTEMQLRASEERFRTIFDSVNDAIFVHDAASGAIIDVNQRMSEMFGYSREEALRMEVGALSSNVPPYTQREAETWISKALGGEPQTFEWQARARDGRLFWVEATMRRAILGGEPRLLASVRDIGDRKKAEDAIYHLTRYDALTGLPNQFLLEYRLTQAIARAAETGQTIGVAMINLDKFHTINDSAGYETGNQTLVGVAARLSAALEEQDTVARLGADTFAALLLSPRDAKELVTRAEKLLVAVAQPIEIGVHEILLSASVGISVYPSDGCTALELIQKTGIAMRHAKTEGGNCYRLFAQDMNARALDEMALSNDLRHAIERDELRLHYQPQVDAFSGQIVGMEALLRWQHPARGLLTPVDFISLAEENGLIVPIGGWVLREACRQTRKWHESGHSRPFVSVNVSALQFKQGNLAQSVIEAITESGLSPNFVELELTESMLVSHFEQTLAAMKELKTFGVHFAIDDFGTGYSSLNYLKHFPIDKLKIDISFITDIVMDADSAAIVKAMIAMGHSLELKVIAEGVETEAQAGYLRTLHCDEMQGFHFGRPAPAQEIVNLLEQHPPPRNEAGNERILLLVDDEANVLSALKRILRRDGYHILSAGSAQEGLELLARHPVGVILSDQRMPGMTGIEFLSKVKVMYPDIVRMVLSGYTEVSTMSDAINRGAIYKFLTKPWEEKPLREAIQEAFVRHETQRDEERRP
jgi:diguanylate cyclase (GGDEF)-like protein/PAS domain S-box-containing protein